MIISEHYVHAQGHAPCIHALPFQIVFLGHSQAVLAQRLPAVFASGKGTPSLSLAGWGECHLSSCVTLLIVVNCAACQRSWSRFTSRSSPKNNDTRSCSLLGTCDNEPFKVKGLMCVFALQEAVNSLRLRRTVGYEMLKVAYVRMFVNLAVVSKICRIRLGAIVQHNTHHSPRISVTFVILSSFGILVEMAS